MCRKRTTWAGSAAALAAFAVLGVSLARAAEDPRDFHITEVSGAVQGGPQALTEDNVGDVLRGECFSVRTGEDGSITLANQDRRLRLILQESTVVYLWSQNPKTRSRPLVCLLSGSITVDIGDSHSRDLFDVRTAVFDLRLPHTTQHARYSLQAVNDAAGGFFSQTVSADEGTLTLYSRFISTIQGSALKSGSSVSFAFRMGKDSHNVSAMLNGKPGTVLELLFWNSPVEMRVDRNLANKEIRKAELAGEIPASSAFPDFLKFWEKQNVFVGSAGTN